MTSRSAEFEALTPEQQLLVLRRLKDRRDKALLQEEIAESLAVAGLEPKSVRVELEKVVPGLGSKLDEESPIAAVAETGAVSLKVK